MALPDLAIPENFLLTVGVLFIIVSTRFFFVAGLFHFIFYKWQRKKWETRKINKAAEREQFVREMKYSFLSSGIFSLVITITLLCWQKGWTQVYEDPLKYGWAWLPVSLLISFLIHEFYYYWMHRWMHRPEIFRKIHRVHHSSRIPTPWTAFSFHPMESLLLSIIFPVIVFIVPMHPVVIILQLVLMTISSVINHLDIELFPPSFYRSLIGRHFIGSTHHSLHHTNVNYNYGLHFTVLDKVHNTEFTEPRRHKDTGSQEKSHV